MSDKTRANTECLGIAYVQSVTSLKCCITISSAARPLRIYYHYQLSITSISSEYPVICDKASTTRACFFLVVFFFPAPVLYSSCVHCVASLVFYWMNPNCRRPLIGQWRINIRGPCAQRVNTELQDLGCSKAQLIVPLMINNTREHDLVFVVCFMF